MKNKIIKYLLNLISKHQTAPEQLKIRFVDEESKHRYYGFNQKPPPERYAAILKHHDLLTTGLSVSHYKKAVNGVINSLKNGIDGIEKDDKKSKDMVKAFALLFEMEARGGEPSYDAILEILSLTLIRNDENPNIIDSRIHQEKKKYLNNLLESNPSRIEKLPEYSMFYDSGLGGEMIKELQQRNKLTNDQIDSILKY